MKTESYIIGSGFAPEWCRRFIQPFRKMDGTTGYEFNGRFIDLHLEKGDELIREDGSIKIKRKGGEQSSERKEIFATD